jgi:anti-sigma factor RsiW
VSCDPVQVTGFVDGALAPSERSQVEAHLETCETCRAQAEAERTLRARLASLAPPPFPAALESAVRERLRQPVARRRRIWPMVLLPMAAVLVIGVVFAHTRPALVARQIAWDHGHCFGQAALPAQVWSSNVGVVERWFADRGTRLPRIPESAGGMQLVGARYCRVVDRRYAHLYYADGERHLSLHVVPGWLSLDRVQRGSKWGRAVVLMRTEGAVVGLTSEDPGAVDAFVRELSSQYVSTPPPVLFARVDPPPAR